jgi:cephalosporin-C deacetylase
MPLIDMPLAELRTYTGRSPRPADFDGFWENGLSEMRGLDPDLCFVLAKFQAKNAICSDVYFTGVGGARIHAQYVRPAAVKDPIPCVLMFHGYSGDAGEWSGKLAYANMGVAVLALDARGQGGYSQDLGGVTGTTLHGHIIRGLDDPPEKLLFRSIFLDCAQLAGIALTLPEIDPNRVYATGGSQGGGLTVACAALEPRVAKAAPVYPFLSDYRRVWEMDLAKHAYGELREYFRHYDPLHQREEEIFTKLGYIDIQHLAGRIRGEVLWAIGLMDEVCPPSTQFAAYNKITAPKGMLVYPDFGHEGLPWVNDRIYEFLSGPQTL